MHPTGKGINSSYSPSFNSYFNTDLAEIAARVTTEFPESDDFAVDEGAENEVNSADNGAADAEIGCEDDGDDFEFDLSNLMPEDGEIRPVYPVFNRDLLRDFEIESRPSDPEEADASRAQIQLKSLFLEDRDRSNADLDPPSSSSSSEAGDLEEIVPGTYCAWAANEPPADSPSPSPGRCTKSNSTGSSVTVAGKAKAWRLKDFMRRSKSDGKEGLMMLTPKKKAEASVVRGAKLSAAASSSAAGNGGKPMRVRPAVTGAAREGYYGGSRSKQGGENKRRSYLPYRQDLVGLFATPQAFRKMHLPPF